MYSKLIVFIFIPFTSLIFAQSDTTKKIFYYDNGKVSSEGLMVNGEPVGYWKAYYEDGVLKSEGGRTGLQVEGSWKFYHQSGNISRVINYENGVKEGLTLIYDDSNNLVREEHYSGDLLHGKSREYYAGDSAVKWVIPYDKGILDGTAFEYERDGRIITIVEYNHGFIKKKEEINRKNSLGKQGTWRELYTEGTLHIESRYKNNILHGYYKEYDRDGKLITALLYIDGILQENPEELANLDIKREYYESGEIKWEGTYNYQGQKEGTFKYFDEKGGIERAEIFSKDILLAKGKINEKGERIDHWEFYYPDGALRAKGDYSEGLRIGEWHFLYNDGKIEQKGKFVKDEKPHGDWTWYYNNGQVWREEGFWKGKEEGLAVEYSESGAIVTKGEYIDGKKDGIWFHEMGDHKEEGKYVEGRREGEWVYTYSNGKPNFKGSYINGDANGRHVYFYPNGRVKREEYYELGFQEGSWKSYDQEGNLTITSQWEGGKEVKIDKKKVK